MVWHPVAVLQYTFTHKEYTKEHNICVWVCLCICIRVFPLVLIWSLCHLTGTLMRILLLFIIIIIIIVILCVLVHYFYLYLYAIPIIGHRSIDLHVNNYSIIFIIIIIIIIGYHVFYRVFTIMHVRKTTPVGYKMLQLLRIYNLWYMWCYFPCLSPLYFYISTFRWF